MTTPVIALGPSADGAVVIVGNLDDDGRATVALGSVHVAAHHTDTEVTGSARGSRAGVAR